MHELALQETAACLGPACVKQVTADKYLIEFEGREVWATLALGYPYAAKPGDVVLAIGAAETFVIGVIKGSGETRLSVSGNLTLHATGRVDIEAGKGISLQSPRVSVRAEHYETFAQKAVMRCVQGFHWIKKTLQIVAGRQRTMVEGESTLHAKKITGIAEDEVRLDGNQLKLG